MTVAEIEQYAKMFGYPAVFLLWIWWQSRSRDKDPFDDMRREINRISHRLTRVETQLEERR